MSIAEWDDTKWGFYREYTKQHPEETPEDKLNCFADHYSMVTTWWAVMSGGYARAEANYYSYTVALQMLHTSTLAPMRLWLLYGMQCENFHERLISIIIEEDDVSLDVSAYALLLYISYQDEDTAAELRKLPFSLLYDMFDSIITNNVEAWFES
jgi:hypothetical protein